MDSPKIKNKSLFATTTTGFKVSKFHTRVPTAGMNNLRKSGDELSFKKNDGGFQYKNAQISEQYHLAMDKFLAENPQQQQKILSNLDDTLAKREKLFKAYSSNGSTMKNYEGPLQIVKNQTIDLAQVLPSQA